MYVQHQSEFWTLQFLMFLKEVSYAHQAKYIYIFKIKLFCNNTIQMFAIQWVSIFFKEINTFIHKDVLN